MFNQDVRQDIKRAGLFQYQIAEKLGVCEMTFIRKLRHELPLEEKEKIREIIAELTKEAG